MNALYAYAICPPSPLSQPHAIYPFSSVCKAQVEFRQRVQNGNASAVRRFISENGDNSLEVVTKFILEKRLFTLDICVQFLEPVDRAAARVLSFSSHWLATLSLEDFLAKCRSNVVDPTLAVDLNLGSGQLARTDNDAEPDAKRLRSSAVDEASLGTEGPTHALVERSRVTDEGGSGTAGLDGQIDGRIDGQIDIVDSVDSAQLDVPSLGLPLARPLLGGPIHAGGGGARGAHGALSASSVSNAHGAHPHTTTAASAKQRTAAVLLAELRVLEPGFSQALSARQLATLKLEVEARAAALLDDASPGKQRSPRRISRF